MIRVRDDKVANPQPARIEPDEDFFSAVPKPSARREIWVGFFVLAGLIAGLVALFALTDPNLFRNRFEVTTMVTDAGGVRKGDPVQMLGVRVGRVRGFAISPQGGVAIQLELEREHTIPADSRVVLMSQGLLGGKIAEIIPGSSQTPLRAGAVIPGVNEGGVFESADDLGTQAEDVLGRMQALLADRTVDAVGTSAVELQTLLAQLSATVAAQRTELQALSGSLRRTASSVERATAGPELERSIARLDQLTARLDETSLSLDRAGNSLETVLARVERGEGTLGRLTTDAALYENLNQAAVNLNRLTEDIQQNPRRYINLRVF
ncbi:hypothetical protein BH24GEM3_BH24GEM3_20020 [soil metagenome]